MTESSIRRASAYFANVGTTELVKGWFTFASNESARFRDAGKIKFHYGELANSQAFIKALEKFLHLDPAGFTEVSSAYAISVF